MLGVFLICAYIVFDYKEGDLGIVKFKKKNENEKPVEDISNSGEDEQSQDTQTDEKQNGDTDTDVVQKDEIKDVDSDENKV